MKGIVSAPIHSHANKEVLDGITVEKIKKWDAGGTGGGGGVTPAAAPSYELVQVCNDAYVRFRWAQTGGISNLTCSDISNCGRYELVVIDGSDGYAFGVTNETLGKTDYIKAQNIIDAAKLAGVEHTEISGKDGSVIGVKIKSGANCEPGLYYDGTENGVSFTDKSGLALFGGTCSLATLGGGGAPVFYGALYESVCNQAMRRTAPSVGSVLDEQSFSMTTAVGMTVTADIYPTGTYYLKDCPVPGESGPCVMTVNALPLHFEGGIGALSQLTCFAIESGGQYRGLFMDRAFYIANRTASVVPEGKLGKWYKMTGEEVV